MKKMQSQFKKLLAICIVIGVFGACKKNHQKPQIVINTINVDLSKELANKETYTLDLTQYGDADDVSSIVTQATTYTTSEISNNTGTDKRGLYTYMYDASNLTTGKIVPTIIDSVLIKIAEGAHEEMHHGCGGDGGEHHDKPKHKFSLFHKHEDPKVIVEDEYYIKIKFTINNTTTVNKTTTMVYTPRF